MPMDLSPEALQRAILLSKLTQTDTADRTDSASVAKMPEKSGMGPWPYAAMIGGNVADAVTTAQALSSGRGREGGLLPGGVGGNLAAKAGGTLGLALLMREVAKHHPTAAKWLGYGDGAAMGAVAAHNASVGR